MEETGTWMRHSFTPNFKIAPFYWLEKATSYSIAWPVGDIPMNGVLTRNFFPSYQKENVGLDLMSAFFNTPTESFDTLHSQWKERMEERLKKKPVLQDALVHRNLASKKAGISIGGISVPSESSSKPVYKEKYKVWTDYTEIREHIKSEHFVFVEDLNEAEIVWATQIHWRDFKDISAKKIFVNQFEGEEILTMKHLLAALVELYYGTPNWFCLTFNLETQLPVFISEFKKRQVSKHNNHWILKPWNYSRSIGTVISDNLSQIIRMKETGPKLACEYIDRPLLFKGLKFDLRFIVLLNKSNPLDLYVYKRFYPRLSPKNFAMTYTIFFVILTKISKFFLSLETLTTLKSTLLS